MTKKDSFHSKKKKTSENLCSIYGCERLFNKMNETNKRLLTQCKYL